MRFKDRQHAGKALAERISALGLEDPIVLALPRGGVPVAMEVGAELGVPVDVFIARKVGAPTHPEFGIGAVAEGSERLVLSDQAQYLRLSDERLRSMARAELDEVDRRVRTYRGERPLPDMRGRNVVVVDDGLATGVTAQAALEALSERDPKRLVLAVPACAGDTVDRLSEIADVICVHVPAQFRAVGLWYENFDQVTDEEVIEMLDRAGTQVAR